MKLKLLLVLVASTIFLTPFSHAQLGIGASFTAQHIVLDPSSPSSTTYWLYGPTFQLQKEYGKVIKYGFDARGSILSGSGVGVDAIDLGPRIAIHPPVLHIKPYGEVLIGGVGVRPNFSTKFTTHIDLQFLGGIDVAIAKRIDWRVIEYSYGEVPGFSGIANEDRRNQFSTGIMLRPF
jgi:hypothetical protein